jgi:hypothetical protein
MALNLLAQAATPTPAPGLGTLEGIGILGGVGRALTNEITAIGTFVNLLSNIIGVMTIIAIIWFTFVLLTGAIGWLASGGDKTKLQNAQKQITTGIIGLIIVLSATFLIDFIGSLVGIPNILSVAEFIKDLGPK